MNFSVTSTQSKRQGIYPRAAVALAEDHSLYAVFSLIKPPGEFKEARVHIVNPSGLRELQEWPTKEGKKFTVLGEFPFLLGYDHPDPAHSRHIIVQLTNEDGTPHYKRAESLLKAMDMLGMQHQRQRNVVYDQVLQTGEGDGFSQRILPTNAERKSSVVAGDFSLHKFRKDLPQRTPLR